MWSVRSTVESRFAMAAVTLKNLSSLIKKYRDRSGFTQAELAAKLKISLRTLQRIELGESSPSLEVLINLARVLNFKIAEVFRFKDEISNELLVLARTAEFLEEITRIAKVGGWNYDVLKDKLFWTDVAKKMHGLETGRELNIKKTLGLYKKGKNRDALRKALVISIKKKVPFKCDVELETTKGKAFHVVVNGFPVVRNGKCVSIHGTFQDGTEQINLEKRLRECLSKIHNY